MAQFVKNLLVMQQIQAWSLGGGEVFRNILALEVTNINLYTSHLHLAAFHFLPLMVYSSSLIFPIEELYSNIQSLVPKALDALVPYKYKRIVKPRLLILQFYIYKFNQPWVEFDPKLVESITQLAEAVDVEAT